MLIHSFNAEMRAVFSEQYGFIIAKREIFAFFVVSFNKIVLARIIFLLGFSFVYRSRSFKTNVCALQRLEQFVVCITRSVSFTLFSSASDRAGFRHVGCSF